MQLVIADAFPERFLADFLDLGLEVDYRPDVTAEDLGGVLERANVLVALKVRFPQDMIVADVERITNTLEEKLRAAHPELKRIFVEADSVYDPTKDTEYL